MKTKENIENTKNYKKLLQINLDEFLERDKSGKGWTCPACNSGQNGKQGTGLKQYGTGSNVRYTCFAESTPVIGKGSRGMGVTRDAVQLYAIKRGISHLSIPQIAEQMAREFKIPWNPGGRIDFEAVKRDYVAHAKAAVQELQNFPGKKNLERHIFNGQYILEHSDPESPAWKYLETRGISRKTALNFGLGFIEVESGSKTYPCIMIPASNSFCFHRNISDSGPKYINITGTHPEIFNVEYLKAPDKHALFITEGVLDALSIEQMNFPAIALPSVVGIKEFEKQLHEHKSFAADKAFILCLDNDQYGKDAALQMESLMKGMGYRVYYPADLLGKYKDANEVLQTGSVEEKKAFAQRLEQVFNEALELPAGEAVLADPVPLEDAFSSEFKAEWIPEPYRAYSIDAARSLCQPVEEVALALMCAVSYVGSKVFKIKAKGVETHINLMLLMAADPSEKKSSCLTKAKSLITKFEADLNEKLRQKKREYDDKIKINNARINDLRNRIAKAQNTLLLGDEKPIKKRNGTVESQEDVRERLENLVNAGLTQIAQLTEENEAMSRINCERDYLIDSSTVEGIRDALIDTNERMAVFSDEGGLFKIMGGLYTKGGKNSDTDVIKKAWDGTYTSVRRAGTGAESRKFKLYEPLLTICLYVQPHVVMEAFNNKEFDEEGLLARFLISKPNMEPYRKELGIYQDPALRVQVENVFTELIRYTDKIMFGDSENDEPVPAEIEPKIMRLLPPAEELFHKYFDLLEDRARSKEGRLHKSVYRKHAFTTLRVIAALHLMKEGPNALLMPVTAETVQNGIEMGEYFLSGYFAVRGGADSKARFMAEYIIECFQKKKGHFKDKPDTVKWREISQTCRSRTHKIEDIRMGVDYLIARGWLIPIEEERAKTYTAHPAIYTYKSSKE